MNLYLIRHGESENGIKADDQRALTAQGRSDAEKMAKWVSKVSEPPLMIFSSPLKRAVETAEPFAKVWKLPVVQADWLRAAVEPSMVLKELCKIEGQSVALVGHLPNLGLLLGTLVWGLPPKEVVIPKLAVAFLSLSEWKAGAAKLRWMITPELVTEQISKKFAP